MADVTANGVRLHVQRLGAGAAAARTVVFVHGLVMDNLSSFYFTLANPVAAAGADVVLYDLRGHGLSGRPAAGYAVPDLVADLAALLDALDVARPVHLVGNSVGGTIVLAFAAAHPERVASLALIDAHDGAEGWAAQMTATLALRGDARDAKIAETFAAWLGRHSERKRSRLATAAQALVEGTSLVADLAASPPLDAAALARIRCPVLAIYGERSDVRDRGEALAAALPACTLRLLPGCTHSVLWEATAEVRAALLAWLEEAA
ncbi:MAG: alpha/beta fold hydrolase [Kofleriaceae bacterium]|nr:alpha/beta fold hydrolase [Kofleriaceae bacterium]